MDKPAQKGAGGENHGAGGNLAAVGEFDPANAPARDNQVIGLGFNDLKIGGGADRRLHRRRIELAVGLRARTAHSRAFAPVKDTELDAAFVGLMGHVADKGGIQFRVLNRRKGPAVRGPRAQADRKLYATAMQTAIRATPNLEVIEAEADDLIVAGGRVCGVKFADGREIAAGAVVLTTDTFLRGLTDSGETQMPAGRAGASPALCL